MNEGGVIQSHAKALEIFRLAKYDKLLARAEAAEGRLKAFKKVSDMAWEIASIAINWLERREEE